MRWYHLNPNLKFRIVCQGHSDDEGDLEPAIPYWLQHLPPDAIYNEPRDPRVCVAPSVWQCLCGLGREDGSPEGCFNIYYVDVEGITEPSGPAGEAYISDEKWITDNNIQAEGGSIQFHQIGWIDVFEPFHEIKMNTLHERVLELMKAEENEQNRIWTICDESGQWSLNKKGLAEIRREAEV